MPILHAIEDEELRLRPEICRVADAGRPQVRLRLLRRGSRIARIGLAGRGLDNVAEYDQARLRGERVHHRRLGVQPQDHVALVDRLPAGDRRAIEHDAVAERVLLDRGDMLRSVLPLAARISKPQVHILDGVLLQHLHHLARRRRRPAGLFAISSHPALSAPAGPSRTVSRPF